MPSRRHRQTKSRSPRRHAAGGRILGPIARILLRLLFALPRRAAQPRLAQAGFILPTVVLLLLVVSLTVGSITLRTFTRTTQAIGDRQQQVIYNAATPAIDRAKAKLEYLFSQDERMPSGVPGEGQLLAMMANDGINRGGLAVAELEAPLAGGEDVTNPYTFDDETAIEIDGLAGDDNAWQFPVDSDSDGENDTVVAYSILFQTPDDLDELADSGSLDGRASSLEVRNAPLSSAAASSVCNSIASGTVQEGWFSNAGSPIVSKNFQVNAIAIPGQFEGGELQPNPLGTVATLEFQQDRQINQGNKWGAWFRNDLEVFPGPQFRWNGAMHTEGNFIVGESARPAAFNAFLVSSTASCLNTSAGDSEITLGEPTPADNGGVAFIGQVISGRVVGDTANDERSNIHVFDPDDPIDTPAEGTTLDDDTDSVAATLPVSDLALDPVRLLAEDVSAYRNPPAAEVRDGDWPVGDDADGAPVIDRRIRNESEPLPRVGDSYRADDRFGPQPRYPVPSDDGDDDFIGVPALGLDIPAGNAGLVGDGGGAVDAVEIGLDGYWERRARNQGMRVIVGPRLQLGDPHGWDGADESLYPFGECTANNVGDCHTARQRRTLADHLAAVQATAIYRAGNDVNDGDLPSVCLATTVHPGTAKTLRDSATFEALQIPPNSLTPAQLTILTDFFTGRGTNGWEFEFPYAAAEIPSAVAAGSAMGIALRNLTQFAGDPLGGAPSFPPVQDAEVHPYPLMSMWGDFSKQRRILELLDGGIAYNALSPADKASLHTAICTLSMLAYNVNYLTQFVPDPATNGQYGDLPPGDGSLTALINQLGTLPDLPPEELVAELEALNAADPATVTNNMLAIARVVVNKEQVNRDRIDGFRTAGTTYICPLVGGGLEPLCADGAVPKYPILHALFPPADITGIVEATGETRDVATPYITATNVATYEPISVVNEPDLGFLGNFGPVPDVIGIPRPSPTPAAWTVPIEAAEAGIAIPNSNTLSLIACVDEACGAGATGEQIWRVPFKDSAFYDGRERMSIRALDIDLELLRENNFTTGEPWLPLSGIVFAFREDAVREDAIVRPAGGALQCNAFAVFAANLAACQTNAAGDALIGSTDPSLLARGFSMKAVDFVADPDRRPHGFRLFNGVTLKRAADGGIGMSLVSDNSVYIKGPFNLHQQIVDPDAGVINQLEEFDELLDEDWGNFYDREILDNNFANPAVDDWRPTEVLADAVTILSRQFCDGSIEDSFITAGSGNAAASLDGAVIDRYGCDGIDRTSYLNQNRPSNDPGDWQRQNPADEGSPIVVDRNGNPVEDDGAVYDGNFFNQDENALSPATEQIVNLSIISGIVPSRDDQPYGGLHNFPRLNEDWDDIPLSMSGTFFQLNFSTAATAPYDQEVWEPGEIPAEDRDRFPYYNPPNRLWGYDVALQYVQAAPIASRFASPNAARSEFYSEPTLDDPYIAQLCREVAGDGSFCPAP